jgi:hypothetical protein
MAFPLGLSLERLTEVADYINNYMKENIQEFDEREFINCFADGENFMFSFSEFYSVDEVVLADFLYHGIQMEYGDILVHSDGKEFDFEECRDLIRWFFGHDYKSKGWKNRDQITDEKFDLNLQFYNFFREHIRNEIHPQLNVKSKIEIKGKTDVYHFFIGLQAKRGLPIGFTIDSVIKQFWKKRDKAIEESIKLEKSVKNYKRKITKSAARCARFLRMVANKYKAKTPLKKNELKTEIGKLVDFYVKLGVNCSNKESEKLSEQIYSIISTMT